MNWQQLRDSIYYLDGSLRDIYVLNTTKDDWIIWADFVNQNYPVKIHNEDNKLIDTKVDLTGVFDCWAVNEHSGLSAIVLVDNVIVQSYFFSDQEIENDISPIEVNSMYDHIKLVDYMIGLSKALNKKVILSPENESETELIKVYNNEVTILL